MSQPGNSLRNTTLDSFVNLQPARPPPEILATSQEIRDRGSIFIANLCNATNPDEAKACARHIKHITHGAKPAAHEIAAWRCMVLKDGRTGLGGPDDFELKVGQTDDGERWAGGKVLKVMQDLAILDVVVVVSRWYGGVLLGPARFDHIETCAAEVCREYKRTEELKDCVASLTSLDTHLAELRAEVAKSAEIPTEPEPPQSGESSHVILETRKARPPDYSTLDVARARKLVRARESAIKHVKALLSSRRRKAPDGNNTLEEGLPPSTPQTRSGSVTP